MRNAFADEMTRLARQDSRVVLLSGDIGNKLFDNFKKVDARRFYNCGVAEANMMGVAAGLALSGLRPVACHLLKSMMMQRLATRCAAASMAASQTEPSLHSPSLSTA